MTRTLYNCRSVNDGWMLAKFDPDFNVAAVYTVKTRDEKPQLICDCPGWHHKSICKHTRMVSTFALGGAIDSDRFYCYETQTWHQPIQVFGENDTTAEKAANITATEIDRRIADPTTPSAQALARAEAQLLEPMLNTIKTMIDEAIVPAGPTTSPTPTATAPLRRRV